MSDDEEGDLALAIGRLQEEASDPGSARDSGEEDSTRDRRKFRSERGFPVSRDYGRGSGPRSDFSRSPSPSGDDPQQEEEHQQLSQFAQVHVPPAPRRPGSSARQVIALPADHLAQFEEWAKGKFLSTAERTTLLADLPVPDSPFAFSPVVDTELRGIAKESKRFDRVEVFTQDIDTIYELSLNSINILALVKALGNREDLVIPQEVMEYLNLQGELLGAVIKMGIGWKREALTKQLGIPRTAIPSMKSLEIDSATTVERDGSARPEIFGKTLREEILKADNPTRRAIDRLKSSSSSVSSSAKKSQAKSQFSTGRVDKQRRSSGQHREDRNRSSAASRPGPSRVSSSSVKGQSAKKKV